MRVRTRRLVTVSGLLAAVAGLVTALLTTTLTAPYGAEVVSYSAGFAATALCGYVAIRAASAYPIRGWVKAATFAVAGVFVAVPFAFGIPSYPAALSNLLTGVVVAVPAALSAMDRSEVGVEFEADLDVLPTERPST